MSAPGRRLGCLRLAAQTRGSSKAVERSGARPHGGAVEPTVPLLIDLVDAACRSGAPVPAALDAAGTAAGGRRGALLVRVGAALSAGAVWDRAWQSDAAVVEALAPLAEALRPAWVEGSAPSGPLGAAADRLRREQAARAAEAAARLGVGLVLPLGLCQLPAFVLVGIVPVLVSLAGVPAG